MPQLITPTFSANLEEAALATEQAAVHLEDLADLAEEQPHKSVLVSAGVLRTIAIATWNQGAFLRKLKTMAEKVERDTSP